VTLEIPELRDIKDADFKERSSVKYKRSHAFAQAELLLERMLRQPKVDEDLGDYLRQIDEAHEQELEERRGHLFDAKPLVDLVRARKMPRRREIEDALAESITLFRWADPPAKDGTVLGGLAGDLDTCLAYPDFIARYSYLGSQSTWHEWRIREKRSALRFTNSLVVRTHLYLIASQVLDAPYRPDLLRGPICTKFFAGKIDRPGIGERMVRFAELNEQRRTTETGEVFGIREVLVVPLLLAQVMRSARRARDLISEIRSLRDSDGAKKFRDHVAALKEAKDQGRVETLARAIQQYADMLSPNTDLSDMGQIAIKLGTSIGKVTMHATSGNLLALTSDIGTSSFGVARTLGRQWRGRKTALIARSVRSSRKLEGLQPSVKRLFGHGLSDADLDLLRRVNFPV
jgi:hypothetical protein